jgi:hypothetical protein
MARIRTIKPSFFTSLTIAGLTLEQRLTFIGLWTHCDDEGRCVYDPRLLKAALWPLDDRTAGDLANDSGALQEASLITLYEVDGRQYLAINAWLEHQKISHPSRSTLPHPKMGTTRRPTCTLEDSGNPPGILPESSGWERKGKEGNREGKGELPSAPTALDFDEFWSAYPRTEGKKPAHAAYLKAVKRVPHAEIMAQLHRQLADPNRPDVPFWPHGSSWLNQDRWNDTFTQKAGTNTGPVKSTSEARASQVWNLIEQITADEEDAYLNDVLEIGPAS